MFFDEGATYVKKNWLNESPLWSRALVNLLETAMQKHIFGNNQHSEGIIKHIKEQGDLHLHTQQLATYMWWWWRNSIMCGKTLVRDYRLMPAIVNKRRKRAAGLMSVETGATADAVENERVNNTNAIWDVSGYQGPKGEQKLKEQLLGAMAKLKNDYNTTRHAALTAHVASVGVGHLVGFKLTEFNGWMNGYWPAGKRVKTEAKVAMLSYIHSQV